MRKTFDFRSYNYIIILSLQKGGDCISEQKKIGRPTDSPKNVMMRFRIDDETLRKLDECSKILKISRSEVLRAEVHRLHAELHRLLRASRTNILPCARIFRKCLCGIDRKEPVHDRHP